MMTWHFCADGNDRLYLYYLFFEDSTPEATITDEKITYNSRYDTSIESSFEECFIDKNMLL